MKTTGLIRLMIIDALNSAAHFRNFHLTGATSFKEQYRFYINKARELNKKHSA